MAGTQPEVLFPRRSLQHLVRLDNIVKEMVSFYESGITTHRSAKLVLDNLYTLGLLNDISLKVRQILSSSNRFLLSDAGDVLRQI
ncbi:MAG: hypothetical protein R2727_12320 [Bacteroidales bacterium]